MVGKCVLACGPRFPATLCIERVQILSLSEQVENKFKTVLAPLCSEHLLKMVKNVERNAALQEFTRAES